MDFSTFLQGITPNNLGTIAATFLGVFLATLLQKKLAPKTAEEKKAAEEKKVQKQEAKTLKAIENAKKEGQKLEDMKGAQQ